MMLDQFWAAVDAQLAELATAKSATDVVSILNKYENPSCGDAFFAGSGGDGSIADALDEAGWHFPDFRADYHWCATAPDGSQVTYVEGDVYYGNSMPPGGA
jgi:hypothetical protein